MEESNEQKLELLNQINRFDIQSETSSNKSVIPIVNYKSRADKEYVDEDSQDNSSDSNKTTKSKVNKTSINYLRS